MQAGSDAAHAHGCLVSSGGRGLVGAARSFWRTVGARRSALLLWEPNPRRVAIGELDASGF